MYVYSFLKKRLIQTRYSSQKVLIRLQKIHKCEVKTKLRTNALKFVPKANKLQIQKILA
jgi:hypothetical protein